MFIYKITNKENGKFYIGKTQKSIEKRWATHIKNAKNGRTSKLYSAIRKYGVHMFEIEIMVCMLKCASIMDLNKMEKRIINEMRARELGYNMTDGGDGGGNAEYLVIHARMRKGKTADEIYGTERAKEISKRISMRLKGKTLGSTLTNEQRNKISQSLKQRWLETDFREKMSNNNARNAKRGSEHHMFGKTHSVEARQKISNAQKGKTWEQRVGIERAEELKKEIRERFKGSNSPVYKVLDMSAVWEILIKNPRINLQSICEKIKVSRPTLIDRIKKEMRLSKDINFQRFRESKSDDELIAIFETLR